MSPRAQIAELDRRFGIAFPGATDIIKRDAVRNERGEVVSWGAVAMDAQPALVTVANSGIPSFLTTQIDPKVITVLLTPNNAAKIVSETRKGNWLTETAMFVMAESTGEVSSYGDFSNNGMVGVNVQYPQRQFYLFQDIIEYGERQAERESLGYVDYVARLRVASATVMEKFRNQSYFYGIQNLQLYGLLNDPALSAALTPSTKAATGTSWRLALPTEILADIQALFAQLQTQTGSNLELDTPMVLALHSISELYLANTNSFGLTAMEMIKKVFPNLRVQQAPQYLSGTTYSCQLIVDSVQGQNTAEVVFNEKMRAGRLVPGLSSWAQKMVGGTGGAVIYFPAGISQMAGI